MSRKIILKHAGDLVQDTSKSPKLKRYKKEAQCIKDIKGKWSVNATCLSVNTQTANQFFQLRENGEKMAYQIYCDCLLKFFDSSKAVAKVSITDFRNTLGNISPLNAHQMFN